MSTWISKSGTAGLGLILALAACVPMESGLSGPRSASIMNGAMMVAAPRGYCVDRTASQTTAETAVIIMGRCSDTAGVPPAAITATVGAAGSATILSAGNEALAGYFGSTEGRATLSRDGRADAVTVQEIGTANGAIVLHLTDTSVGEYWRAVLGIRGRLVTLAVTPPEDQPLGIAKGKTLLLQAISALREANPDSAA